MLGQLIQKESIEVNQILPAEQNHTEEFREKLLSAQRLGNEFKSKTDLTFNTKSGPMTVSTTVWSVTEQFVQIKYGINIPLKSLIDVDY